jgi:hypothetical protein
MATSQARHSPEAFAQMGSTIFDRDIRPVLLPEDADKFVAIDIESGAYEIDPDDYTATEHLLARIPDAQIWLMRVGQQAAYRIGPHTACGDPE